MNIDRGQFSEREKEVIALLLHGQSNKQIALALRISQSTVEYHLKNIYQKLQVSSRTEAVLRLGKSMGNDTSIVITLVQGFSTRSGGLVAQYPKPSLSSLNFPY